MPATHSAALRVSAASALWSLAASAAAITIGFATGSLALVAFGAVQLFDLAGSLTLVARFRGDGGAEHLEVVVLRVVAAGLIAVGSVTAVFSVVHLIQRDAPDESGWSVALAATSVVLLTLLALRKRYLAVRLPSRALGADGNLTAIGAALAAVTLAGTLTANAFGWWWADPTAALIIAAGAVFVGVTTETVTAR